ncbi:ABC-type branched-chain amino acid transport system, substrate-binding protein [Geodermatophilus siccatus]|uniref:ABC-type branched-chain amino acid transport system, substrate-binding protein n=1 Tax=Geodermatophilus siccatus TaxID=1137991 RepID=A0A1G9YB85_9ACTN|nr:substrate-binding domain-containing protein [Geodermatophilus siccatus]SDN06389.1 ABC-type branched-chain amino acid transport system, substrate-binding protein [Geodermatophilus siccatus]
MRRRSTEVARVGLVVPLQGPAGLFGPSCEAVAATAVRSINDAGVLGRQLAVEVIDGGARPEQVGATVGRLIDAGRIDAVTGWHISAVRHAVAPVTAGRIPYVYTSLYEGGESRPGVFCSGETPARQIAPALQWLRDVCGVRRWFVVGDDYVWPRASVEVTRQFARRLDLQLVGTAYVPLGTDDFRGVVERIRASDTQGVLLYLVGQDAVQFNRVFAEHGLQDGLIRFTPLMEENMLLASGAEATRNLFVCASYFRSLATPSALEFCGDYVDQHGPDAPPLNNAAESCCEGLMALAALARRAGSLDVHRMVAVADGLGYDGPRGPVSFAGNHLQQRVHLAVADGYDFDVLATL